MDITRPINALSQDLARAAQVGGSDVFAAAERLLLALDPAMRLAFIDVLSQAAAEISAALPGVGLSVRLEGREPVFAIEGAPAMAAGQSASPEPTPADDGADEGDMARITLRIPEALKARAEVLASRRGQSLNTWLVTAARAAAHGDDDPSGQGRGRRHGMGRRVTGWAR